MLSPQAFREKIQALRRDQEFNPVIDCAILAQPFYLEEKLYISPPLDWSSNNGRKYYALHGKQLVSMPEDPGNRPASDFLEWHRNHCYRG